MTEEFKHLQAENAQLKAHNRQLAGILENVIKTLNHDAQLVYGKGQKVGHPVWLHKPSSMKRDAEFYEQALQAPAAKLALAEAAVLRVAEYLAANIDNELDDIVDAVEAMQEAKGDA